MNFEAIGEDIPQAKKPSTLPGELLRTAHILLNSPNKLLQGLTCNGAVLPGVEATTPT